MDSSLSHTFSERIRKLRAERGMNQGQFADFVGVSRGAMSYYEQEARVPDIAVLKSICEKCGVSADYMLGIIPDQNHAVSDVCKETGLLPKPVKTLRTINKINAIKTIDIFETICAEFDEPDEAMKLTGFTAASTMVNLLLGFEQGLKLLTLLCAIIFDSKLIADGEAVDDVKIRLPQAHSCLQVDFPFGNLTAALWVNVQDEAASLRELIRKSGAFEPYFNAKPSKPTAADVQQ